MCGFAGLLTTAGPGPDELAAHAERMIEPLVHRGPDDSGVWVDAPAGVALRIPAARDPRSVAARASADAVAIGPVRHGLQRRGLQLQAIFAGSSSSTAIASAGHSDTEVILAAFEQWGIDARCRALRRDVRDRGLGPDRRELSLLRDRIGKKPLYVYREPGLITFGSELKALIAGPSFDRPIDRDALAAYLRYLYVPAPKSIFRQRDQAAGRRTS